MNTFDGAGTHTTSLILDLRDRMARIETKLDGHQEAHATIDKRFDTLEATVADIDERTDRNSSDIAANKVRYATFAAVGAAILSFLSLAGEHIWKALTGH